MSRSACKCSQAGTVMLEFMMSKSTLSAVCFLVIEVISFLAIIMFIVTGLCTTFNLGNFVGCLISIFVLVFSIRRADIALIISNISKSVTGRIFLTAVLSVVIICIIGALILSAFMISAMNNIPEKPAAVIVLGCRVKENGPSLMLEKRIAAAYEYLSENENVICIASGGKGTDEPISEAQAIKNGLVSRGISPDRIILEDKSVNTFENIRNSMEIICSLSLEPRAVIVTSEFHQLRARILAKKHGLEAYSKSSATFLPLLPSYWIREWFGVMHELIIGRK